jgi:hypothetical protein
MNYLLTLPCSILFFPAQALAGGLKSRLDEAVIPSLVSGVMLLIIVQVGHHISTRIWRLARLKKVLKGRRQRHR